VFKIINQNKQKDEVIIPSISFPAVANSIIESGLKPVIVDVDPLNGNISFESIIQALTKNTLAVFVTHYGGIPVNIAKLRKILGYDIFILEDAACAFGSFIDNKACGTLGDFGCWSFDPMKMLVSGEGGAVYFSNKDNLTKAKEYFYLGLPAGGKSGIDRKDISEKWWEYDLRCYGRRSLFTNINAAIALTQFDHLEISFNKRAQTRIRYCDIINGKDNLSFSPQDQKNVIYSNYFYTVFSSDRDKLANYFRENKVYTSFRYYPIHKMDLFKKYAFSNLEGAESFANSALNIPIHHNLSAADIDSICFLLDKWKN